MFCTNCGAQLKEAAKFCGACGTKVEAVATSQGPDRIALDPLASGLPDCAIAIVSTEAEGPDDDDDIRVTVRYTITNDSDEEWSYLDVRVQLLSSAGLVIDETRDSHEQSIGAGETEEFETGFSGIKAGLLGAAAGQAHAVVSVVACTLHRQDIGITPVPGSAYELAPVSTVDLLGVAKLVAAGLWKTEPDDDKDCKVEVKGVVQNLTDKPLHDVRLTAEVNDRQGRELTDAGAHLELRPGEIAALTGSGYVKEKKLVGAVVKLAFQACRPVAAGIAQQQGLSMESGGQMPPHRARREAPDETGFATGASDASIYTPWRYFAPATLYGEASGALPESAVATILELTGFSSEKELKETLDSSPRNDLPEDLQTRLATVFSIEVNASACERELSVCDSDGNEHDVPFPFAGIEGTEPKITIGAFGLERTKAGVTIGFRAQIEAPGLLVPASDEAAAVCTMIAEGSLADADEDGRSSVAAWLSACGLSEDLAQDDDFLENLDMYVRDRTEEMVALLGHPDLVDEDDLAVIDCSEEEKGISVGG